MLVKVSKDLKEITVIHGGEKYKFDLDVTFAVRGDPAGGERSLAAAYLANVLLNGGSVKAFRPGYYFSTNAKEAEFSYDEIAKKLLGSTVREVTEFLEDFSDAEREIIVSKIFRMNNLCKCARAL